MDNSQQNDFYQDGSVQDVWQTVQEAWMEVRTNSNNISQLLNDTDVIEKGKINRQYPDGEILIPFSISAVDMAEIEMVYGQIQLINVNPVVDRNELDDQAETDTETESIASGDDDRREDDFQMDQQ